MLDLYIDEKDSHLPPISENELSDSEVLEEIKALKKKLGDRVVVLGHHYQQDDIIQFADIKGDSLALSQKAAKLNAPYIVFCGVHFMAETADMITDDFQQVILPDMQAGCTMADMATREQVDKAWEHLTSITSEKIVPITYINCSAKLKAFVGENGGSICTSSNAPKIVKWGLDQGGKLLFFPDQHLGRNTAFALGIKLEEMALYNPNYYQGGLTDEQILNAKVILWAGFCSVHQGFNKAQIETLKAKDPEFEVVVHPECDFETTQAADDYGSTAYIIKKVSEARPASKFAIGTEINLVNRLQQEFQDRTVISLSPYQCLCTTMYRVRPRWLLATFRSIDEEKPINVITVDKDTTAKASMALDRMMELSK